MIQGPTLGYSPPPQPLPRPAAPAAPADNTLAAAASSTTAWTANDWALFRAPQFISYHLVWLNDIYFWCGRNANCEEIDKEIDDIANLTDIYSHFYVLAATTTKVRESASSRA